MNIAIILSAGKSKRMKGINKIFYKIKGKPLIFYTISLFEKNRKIKKIILVTRKPFIKKLYSLTGKFHFKKIIDVIEGGKERQDSALLGLKAAQKLGAKNGDLILLHNGTNALVLQKEINGVIEAAKRYGAALLAQKAKDTIKEADINGFVLKTIPRTNIFLAQTPQVIEYKLAMDIFLKAKKKEMAVTDDVSLVEKLGKPVKIIPCSYRNIKTTTRDDLRILETFL